jgi:hypothetical protein
MIRAKEQYLENVTLTEVCGFQRLEDGKNRKTLANGHKLSVIK